MLPDYYSGIDDMPAYNWFMVHETGDLGFVFQQYQKVNESTRPKLSEIWDGVYESYIRVFGFTESFLRIQALKRKISILKCELAITGDRFNNTLIRSTEYELSQLQLMVKSGDYMEAKKAIDKSVRFQIDLKKTSVREFYSYLKDIQDKAA